MAAGNIGTVFERVEVKYMIPKEKYKAFHEELMRYFVLDEYGLTTICNIYYDSKDNDLVSRSIMKPKYKEKLRLRTYGVPTDNSMSFAEIKKKVGGVTYKRRAAMPLWEAEGFLNEGNVPSANSQILRELAYVRDFYGLVPKMFIGYDREAYYAKDDPAFRLTIDRNVRSRVTELSLTAGDAGEPVDPEGRYLMEVKAGAALPLFLSKLFAKYGIYKTSFSKYGAAYTRTFHREARPHAEVRIPEAEHSIRDRMGCSSTYGGLRYVI